MAMSAGQQGISQSDLQSQLAAGQASSSGGADEEQSDFADFITKSISGGWVLSMAAKTTGVNVKDIENAAVTKVIDSQSPVDKKIQGLAVMANQQGNFIWKALKMVMSNRAITDLTAGVGGSMLAEGGSEIGGGGGGEGGGGGGGGEGSEMFAGNFPTMASFVESFAPSIPIESLGSISAQTFASAAPSVGMGMDIG